MSPVPWILEWKLALARPRLFALNVTIPLLLVAPVAFGGAPAGHASAVYAVLFVLFGTFGSAVPLVRDGESGLLGRIVLSGASPGALLVQRVTAQSLLDLTQLAPSVIALSLAGRGIGAAPPVLLALGASLLVANLLGSWVAALARSVAETALFSAVSALLLLHASGVFRTPRPGSVASVVQSASPFGPLHGVVLEAASGAGPTSVGWLALGVWCGAGMALTGLVGPALLEAVRRARRG